MTKALPASKAAADHLVHAYHQTIGLPVTTSNCSNNDGPYQFPEKLILYTAAARTFVIGYMWKIIAPASMPC